MVRPRVRAARERWLGVLGFGLAILLKAAIPLSDRNRRDRGRLGPDKLLHCLTHAGFTMALLDALTTRGQTAPGQSDAVLAGAAVALSITYGVGIEYLQERVPGREFEFDDIVADAVGSVLGVFLWQYITRDLPIRPTRGDRWV